MGFCRKAFLKRIRNVYEPMLMMNMKRKAVLAFATMAVLTSAMVVQDKVMSKEGKVTVVNTTSLTKNVRGFNGPTPVKIYVKGNKIQKVEALKNQETPKFFARAKTVLAKFEGKSVSKVGEMDVDAKTGATFSTKALIKNVQEGAKYYKTHK